MDPSSIADLVLGQNRVHFQTNHSHWLSTNCMLVLHLTLKSKANGVANLQAIGIMIQLPNHDIPFIKNTWVWPVGQSLVTYRLYIFKNKYNHIDYKIDIYIYYIFQVFTVSNYTTNCRPTAGDIIHQIIRLFHTGDRCYICAQFQICVFTRFFCEWQT